MKVLNSIEQEVFNKPPLFNSGERKQFFNFPKAIMDKCLGLRKPEYQINFLVSYGYFKASSQFYRADDFHTRDIQYITSFLQHNNNKLEISSRTRQRQEQSILNYCNFKRFDQCDEDYIMREIYDMIRKKLKPNLIFWRCTDLLIGKNILLPSYHQLSGLITSVFNKRKQELASIVCNELSKDTKSVLDCLFVREQDSDTDINSQYLRYKITLLKKLSQSTTPFKIKSRSSDLLHLKELYDHIDKILPKLDFGHSGIKHYAYGVIKSDTTHLSRRNDGDRYVHAIAFIAHQYYSLQDNLADVLLSVMQSYKNSTKREHRDSCYEINKQRDKSLKSLLNSLDENVFSVLSDIGDVVKSCERTDAEKIRSIQALLDNTSNSTEKSENLKISLSKTNNEKLYLEILKGRSVRLQNRISPIIKVLDFQSDGGSHALVKAIANFKEKDGNITKSAPTGFLDAEQLNAINDGEKFHVSLYKVFLFINIASAVKSGRLNLKHSYKYRPLDDYLISKERWEKEKETLIERAGLKDFVKLEPLFEMLDTKLHQQYKATNRSNLDGNNKHLKIRADKTFTIATPKQEEVLNDTPLKPFFPTKPVPLVEALATVNRYTGFLSELQHWQQSHSKNRATDKTLLAGIIGKGCAIGTPKMARISSKINENSLSNVVNWYFSLDNIRSANDRIIKLLNGMELPNIYRKSKDGLHTSSDGQLFTVRADSLNANYSYKHGGKEQGASAYTFIDERAFLWYSLAFSAAERESHYVIDGLMRNDVVKSDIHSTDSHGYSEAIFAITHLLGFSYAPRIKNLKKQTLYTFKSRAKLIDKEWLITPEKYINKKIIEETWDDILRLVATIKLKETTASEIFHRLNSYTKQHRLYQGLKAFGQIIKSQFILRYINDVELRQAIEKQLNKVELANGFTRAVAVGNPRGFSSGEKEEQEVSEACNRLIKNSIICWNYLYLSAKLARLKEDSSQHKNLLSAIASHSMMSWAHINFLGEYDFSDEKLEDSFGIRLPKLSL